MPQEGDIEAARQVAVGDPVGQHIDLIGGQSHLARLALGRQRRCAVELRDIVVGGHAAVGMACQQNAQFFKTFADGGDGARQVEVALGGASLGGRVGGSVCI